MAADADVEADTPHWIPGLQSKLGFAPAARQTQSFGFEPMSEIYRSGSAELFGTAIIVFVSGFAVLSAGDAVHASTGAYPALTAGLNSPPGNALAELGPHGVMFVAVAVSSIATVLLFLFSRVSGAHFNPAVTAAFVLNRRISVKRGWFFLLAQMLGSIAAGAVLKVVVPGPAESCLGAPRLGGTTTAWTALVLEFMFTLMLVLVYLVRMHPGASAMHGGLSRRQRDFDQAATTRSRFIVKVDDDVGGFASFMVGAVYLVGTCTALPFTGAALNPMRHLGPAVFATISCDAFDHLWIYWVGPMGASLVGTLLHDVWFRPQMIEQPDVASVDDVHSYP